MAKMSNVVSAFIRIAPIQEPPRPQNAQHAHTGVSAKFLRTRNTHRAKAGATPMLRMCSTLTAHIHRICTSANSEHKLRDGRSRFHGENVQAQARADCLPKMFTAHQLSMGLRSRSVLYQ